MGMIGRVVKMDVDGDGKASGAFLCARVAIDIDKPLRRGVLLRISKTEEPKWIEAQCERLPFYCYACGIMGHSEIECPNPVPRNDEGKLPYDIQLRAPEDRKRRILSFSEAAAESFGSGSSSGSRLPRAPQGRGGKSRATKGDDGGSCYSSSSPMEDDDLEVQSPLKVPPELKGKEKEDGHGGARRKLNLDGVDSCLPAKKRKSKNAGLAL